MSTEPTVLYAEAGGVATVTLNRPQALNSFTRQMHRDLWAALDQAEANATVRAMVITGAGRGFCAGIDLSTFDFSPGPDFERRSDPAPGGVVSTWTLPGNSLIASTRFFVSSPCSFILAGTFARKRS